MGGPRILVTGANGFIGTAIVEHGARRGLTMRAATRQPIALPSGVEATTLQAGLENADLHAALRDIDIVVHCAARVHVLRERSANPLAEFRKTNVAGTIRLAQEAAKMGARRFVFVSSIKVNGESTRPGWPFNADDAPAPTEPYGISKWEAEQRLWQVARETGLEVVVVRPPLVYGPGVRANFRTLIRWIRSGRPLPFAAVHNQRSFVALDNLVDLLHLCTVHPAAAAGTFLAADGEDISTAELCRRIGEIAGRPARLFPVPSAILRWCAALAGRPHAMQRLCGWLQVDARKARELLGWRPPLDLGEGLRSAVENSI